jgi:hypothetical protein
MSFRSAAARLKWAEFLFYVVMLTLAAGVAGLLWAVAAVALNVANHDGRPIPPITIFTFYLCRYVFLLPVPWVVWASFALRRRRRVRALVYFSATLILTLLALAVLVATGVTMWRLEIIKTMG